MASLVFVLNGNMIISSEIQPCATNIGIIGFSDVLRLGR